MEIEMMPRNESSSELTTAVNPSAITKIAPRTQGLLLRMFADPNLLVNEERAELVNELRECVAAHPKSSELRVLYGMALCVNLEVQTAMEELREGVRLAPDSFIAQLKMGELWMRLRVCEKAKEHTHRAAMLAQNLAQSELARRQAATIRTMMREGVERGGYTYKNPWQLVMGIRKLWKQDRPDVKDMAIAEIQ